ncbi:MAG: DUF3426 domain-containing protein [Gammaproteobacteria bacterium]|nr:DUF3426 domain-containing protein [Gammaproteobacteria bacterium]
MYTQCPECQIAFRVTAKVLQQASGNVRCGNCGHAFNALEYLSEEMPGPVSQDPGDHAEEPADDLAETSRRLLETLNELAGPDDVRIEDTGVEWRVLDDAAAADVSLSPEELKPLQERRYDDNTPLPDEFDDEEDYSPPEAPGRREDDQKAKSEEFEERQGDLALSEPEDWADILQEVHDPNVESLEVEEELAAIHNELSAIDEALTDEVPKLDESGLATSQDDSPDDIDADLIEQIEAGAVAELAELDDEDEPDSEELGDDEDTGVFESILGDDDLEDGQPEDDHAGVGELDEPAFDRESTGEFDAQIDEAARAFGDGREIDEVDDANDGDSPGNDDEAWQYEIEADGSAETEYDPDFDDVDDDADSDVDEAVDEFDDVGDDEEEELAAAEEKFDFAATMVGVENPEDLFDESSGEVETIIMEGEFIRNEVEDARVAAEHAARSQLDDPATLLDTYALNRGKLRGGRRSYDPPSIAIVGAIVGLSLILVGQFVHNSRQSLATYGFFNSTIAPVYRMLGSPITPDWDINGWQFEATNGSVDEEDTTLTIVSRISNRSALALPYPLIHVELTDRYDDVTGSAILEPAEYLAGNGDPSLPIAAGENFTAVITVDDPSVEVSGYRLKVCYRVEPGTVRCAIEAFKN